MHITAFNGAMRGVRSITHLMLEQLLAGASEAGATVEQISLVRHKIGRCRACLHCWVKSPGKCCQKDDMPALLEKYMQSDVVVMASPVYVDNVTGLMKDFMDRLIPITDPHFEFDETGECRHVKRYDDYPAMVMLSNAGYVQQSAFQVISLLSKRIARNMNGRLIAEIYCGGGGILGLDNPMLTQLIADYKELLHRAGIELVQQQKLSPETDEGLRKQLVPTDVYIEQVNALWDRLIAKGTDNKGS